MKRIASPRRLVILALVTLFVAGLVGHLQAGGMQGQYVFEYTQTAQNRTLAGDCYDPANTIQDICVEMCLLTTDGYAIPQGDFICAPPHLYL